jgi:hypothetical protein
MRSQNQSDTHDRPADCEPSSSEPVGSLRTPTQLRTLAHTYLSALDAVFREAARANLRVSFAAVSSLEMMQRAWLELAEADPALAGQIAWSERYIEKCRLHRALAMAQADIDVSDWPDRAPKASSSAGIPAK